LITANLNFFVSDFLEFMDNWLQINTCSHPTTGKMYPTTRIIYLPFSKKIKVMLTFRRRFY